MSYFDEWKYKEKAKPKPEWPTILTPICHDPTHYGPTLLYIPSGQSYAHTCPTCGVITILHGSSPIY